MSVSGISSGSLINSSTQNVHNNLRQFQPGFQQLGSDLKNGTLSAANQDFATLRGLVGQGNSSSPASSGSPIVQTFHQLGLDLQSVSVSAARQDYTTLKQDLQKVAQNHHRSHLHHAGESSQPFDQSGTTLPSGNVSVAQAAYNSLLLDFQQLGQSTGASLTAQFPELNSNSVSVSA